MENRPILRNPLRRPGVGGKTGRVAFFEHSFYSVSPVTARHGRLSVALERLPVSCAGGVRLVIGEVPLAEQMWVGSEGTDDLPVPGALSGRLAAGLWRGEFHVSMADLAAACRGETWLSAGRSAESLGKRELTISIGHGASASNEQ